MKKDELVLYDIPQYKPTNNYLSLDSKDDIISAYGKKALFLTELEREVAVNIASGVRYKALATLLQLDEKTIRIIANRKHVKEFIKEYVDETTAVAKAKREQYLANIIEAKLDKVTDLSAASNLDVATLIKLLDDMQKIKEKASYQAEQSPVINILNKITKD